MVTEPTGGERAFRHPSFWRGRTLRGVGVLVAAVLVFRLGMGGYLGRALERERQALRQRGEPVAFDQIAPARPTDAENAWVLQMKAHAAIDPAVDAPRSTNLTYPDAPPYGPAWTTLADASEKAHGPVFAMMRRARSLPVARVRSAYSTEALLALQPGLNQARHLANTVVDGAEFAHARGDDAEAVERLRDVLHLARSLRQDATLISQLVAIGLEAITCHGTMITAPGLRLKPGDPGAEAARAGVRRLIVELLDESREPRAFANALRTERLFYEDHLRTEAGRTWAIRPLADAEVGRTNAVLLATIEAARATNWPDAEAVMRRHDAAAAAPLRPAGAPVQPGEPIPRYSRWFELRVNLSRALLQQYRVSGERRSAAVSLAAQMYRADHGRWPARLQELVPGYLPAVPANPFHADGRPLDYLVKPAGLPDGRDRPIVIFGAATAPNRDPTGPARLAQPVYGWAGGDPQYRDLTRFQTLPAPAAAATTPTTGPATGATRPSTGRVDQDPDQPDAPGQDP